MIPGLAFGKYIGTFSIIFWKVVMSIRKGPIGVGGVDNTRTLDLVNSSALSNQMHTIFSVILVLRDLFFA